MTSTTETPKSAERFWQGDIKSVAHARKIISITAWCSLVLSGLLVVGNTSRAGHISAAAIGAFLLGFLPALLLLRGRSVLAAGILTSVTGLVTFALIYTSVMTSFRAPKMACVMLVFAVVYSIFFFASRRALEATRALRDLPAIDLPEVFS